MKEKEFVTAIVLAAGRGTRMGTKIQKQYLDLCGKPVLYYSLHAFQESPLIDEILLVTGEQEIEYCRKEIVEKYQLTKVRKILAGGAERYLSVWNGIQAAENKGCLFIHDGARPFVDEEMIERVYEQVQKEKACVVGMPVKDTIKIADEKEYVQDNTGQKHSVDDTDPAGIFLRYRKRSLRDADAGTTDFRDRRCHGRGTDAESSHPSGVWFV